MASVREDLKNRVYNFSAGPAVLPLSVLEQAQRDLLCLPGAGASILEISHRGKHFEAILQSATDNLRTLLAVPANYQVLFLQGGSRLQFSMIPMNLLRGSGQSADYILTGAWGKSAYVEAVKEGPVRTAWDGKADGYNRIPTDAELDLDPRAAYCYFTSNETIEGVQFATEPAVGDVPLVCDASSDFLHRPLDISRYGLVYACAQKNAGPAGVTVVIIRDDLLERGQESLPGYLNYRSHAKENSMWNTPPTFSIYLVDLVAQWLLRDVGGLAAMHELNQKKAARIYDVMDRSGGFYRGHALPGSRSLMNPTFKLPDAAREEAFLSQASKRGLANLKGHRSVGGIRASIYNAMPWEGVAALAEFMQEFHEKNA